MPRVAVVVPAYNEQKNMAACVESLLALDFPDPEYEIIVVDNGSNDHTRSVLESYGPRIRLLVEPLRGRGHARNCGINHTGAEIVAFTDADCVVDRKWLKNLVSPLADKDVGAVGGCIKAYKPQTAVEKFGDVVHNQEQALTEFEPPYVASANWASRRRILVAIGGFDGELRGGSDVDLAWRLGQWGYHLVYAPDAVVLHREYRSHGKLLRLGVRHGFWSVKILKRHDDYLRMLNLKRERFSTIAELFKNPAGAAGEASMRRCAVVFNLGKVLGRVLGSCRFAYLAL